jgi:shikimate dehydrogenase
VNITGKTQLFALVGHPVRHSLSPAMYNHLFAEHRIDAVYVALDVDPARSAHLAESLTTLDIRGVNLTVPFKRTIVPRLSHATRAAEEAQACNVVIQQDGHLVGYNTDGEGFARGVEEEFGSQAGISAIVLGAGGAARAIAAGLADRRARRVTFLNRSVAAARESAAHLSAYFPGTAFDFAALSSEAWDDAAPTAQLVVNATSGGAAEQVTKLSVDTLPSDAIWCDVNYWMPDPPNLAAARVRGLRVQDGLAMLAHQGALSFELFTGVPVDAAHIRTRLG